MYHIGSKGKVKGKLVVCRAKPGRCPLKNYDMTTESVYQYNMLADYADDPSQGEKIRDLMKDIRDNGKILDDSVIQPVVESLDKNRNGNVTRWLKKKNQKQAKEKRVRTSRRKINVSDCIDGHIRIGDRDVPLFRPLKGRGTDEFWKQWELFSTEYMKSLMDERYGHSKIEHMGGADSTVSDILVTQEDGSQWYAECKSADAATGQVVVEVSANGKCRWNKNLPAGLREVLSVINKGEKAEEQAKERLAWKKAVDNGEDVKNINQSFDIDSHLGGRWVHEMYGNKKQAKFFIMPLKTEDGRYMPVIVPTDRVHECCTFKMQVRPKRSGTSPVSKVNRKNARNAMMESGMNYDGDVVYVSDGKNTHMLVRGLKDSEGNPAGYRKVLRGSDADREYILSDPGNKLSDYGLSGDDWYEVKQRGRTNNLTSIMYLELKPESGLPSDISEDYGISLFDSILNDENARDSGDTALPRPFN